MYKANVYITSIVCTIHDNKLLIMR